MKSKFKPLGNYIRLIDKRNTNSSIGNLLGINITKNFMPSVANVSETDLSKYKVIEKGQFACNIMHVGRDERLPISLYMRDIPSIISPAYKLFEIIDTNTLLPDFLMLLFQCSEFDRFAWFICDSNIRGGLDWERFCEIQIPVPDTEMQKKYVGIYNGLLTNQKCYEDSLDDLRVICYSFIDKQMKSNEKQKLGQFIQQTNLRNSGLEIANLLGISINKKFIPSIANQTDLDISNYKVVRKDDFAYVTVTSRNGEKISIALLNGNPGVISSTYISFEVSNKDILLPEYLYLWFSRPEFNRYARFHSWGSARETFDWDAMCDVMLPIPSLDEQRAIVKIHHTLETRKAINEKLKDAIKPLCPILMRGAIEELAE